MREFNIGRNCVLGIVVFFSGLLTVGWVSQETRQPLG
jgi:hypothetical protein